LQVFNQIETMSLQNEPRLASPGAGLLLPELLIVRMLFALRRWSGSRESFTERFHQERAAIRRLLDRCDEQLLFQRVLIKRPPGLEDSSRDWSVMMTLDHLRIVNVACARIFGSLGNGVVPVGKVSIAEVKPDPEVGVSVIAEYETSCSALLDAAAKLSNLRTKVRYSHPWFGPMDAYAWYALAGVHLGIHRVQIERILEDLKFPNAS
jgi:DinB superfamily